MHSFARRVQNKLDCTGEHRRGNLADKGKALLNNLVVKARGCFGCASQYCAFEVGFCCGGVAFVAAHW